KVYAFERHLDKEKLLVLNNFFAEKVKIKLPENYLQGQVLLSNYKDVTLDETVTLQPYQTLAILVS
ncbi:TPA: alpha-glucosidase C-terminal domain-containing protein, partial [Streptococcus agalactiae]